MWFEISLAILGLILLLFLIFYTVSDGSYWQKHRFLGAFARFIQTSQFRQFIVFFVLSIATIPATFATLAGFWYDAYQVKAIPSTTIPVVNTLLLLMVFLAGMLPVTWSHFRQWRQAVRAMAEKI